MKAPPRLRRDGFTVLEGFIDRAELPELRSEVEAVLREPLAPGCERPHNTLAPLRWDSPLVGSLLASERRLRAVESASGATDLRWISGYVSVKEPGSPALWWHQDWWSWGHPVSSRPAAPQIALLCFLTETSAAGAATRVLAGSHHRSTELHAMLPEAHASEASELDPTHPAMSDHPRQTTLALGPGDAAIIDYRLLHGTHPNLTDSRRACVLLNFAPDWTSLPADVRAHLIRHPALPGEHEPNPRPRFPASLLPDFSGRRRDLPLNRVAPASFVIEHAR